jgi:hypothetical protein
LDCIQKLRHARAGLPQNTGDNELLQLLSEGGAAVEALQRAIEPGAYLGSIGQGDAAKESMHHISLAFNAVRDGAPRVSLYEVTIELDGFLARIDLLRVLPDRLELVEMKAKTNPGEGILTQKRTIRSEWLPYMQDIGFQYHLLSTWTDHHHRALGVRRDLPIAARLLLVDRASAASTADILSPSNFRSSYRIGSRGTRATVEYVSAPPPTATALLRERAIDEELSIVLHCAGSSVRSLKDRGIADCMMAIRAMVDTNTWPSPPESLGTRCKKCEFRVDPPESSGFARCWGMCEFPKHHVAELMLVSATQFAKVIDAHGPTVTIAELSDDELGETQRAHWSSVVAGAPQVNRAFATDPLAAMMPSGWIGQVWFIDFETSAYPIPGRIGGHPYEPVPFQFEGHSLPDPRASLQERSRLEGFLELKNPDPRRSFIDALRSQLPGEGPVFHWHHFERSVLAGIGSSIMAEGLQDDDERLAFIESLVGGGDGKRGRLVDLLPIAKRSFYHPELRGSFSIKRVVPIAWAHPAIRAAFAEGHGAVGDPDWYSGDTDPYDGLPAPPRNLLDDLGGDAVVRKVMLEEDDGGGGVRNGGMAMLAYHYARMFYGADHPEIQAQLRRYCRLDSAAMVMVYGLMRDVVRDWQPRRF